MKRPFDFGPAPAGWRPTRLRSIVTRKKQIGRPDLPLLSVNLPSGVVPRAEDSGRPAASEDLSGYQHVVPGDLVMNQLGKPHGALGVSLHEGIISPAYFVATISPSVDARFLHHLLRTRLYISEYERRGKYMPPNQFDISWDQFRQIELLLPPHADQRAIADFLDRETARIDLLITKKQRMIDLLAQRWAASRHEAVLRGVNPITGVGILPLGWDCPQLGVAVKLQRGHDLPFESRREGSVPVVSSGGVLGYHDQSACQGPAVVTGRYGTVGEVYFIEEDCWPLNTTLYVKDFCGNHPRWVAYLLESIPLDAESEKSAVGGINRNVIGKLWVPRPPVDEQVMIANSLLREQSKYSAARDLLVAQQDLLRERRQALITATVTGEFEVPGVAA